MSARTLPGVRWSCQGCGSCCTDFRLGPVEPEVVADLEARGATALAGGAWVAREPGPDGAEGWFLRHVDGHCVFLLPDRRCAVHAAWGAEAKPGFCREFPYRRLRDPQGDVLVIRPECAGFHAALATGEALADQTAAAAALPALRPPPLFAPPQVAVLPGAGPGLEDWMALEAALLRRWQAQDPEADPADNARALAAAAVAALGRELPPGRRALAAEAVREALRMVAAAAVAQEGAQTEDWQRGLVRTVQRVLEPAAEPRALAPDARRYLHVLLGQAVLGKHVVASGGFVALMGRFVFEVELVRAAPGSGPCSSAEASAVLVPFLRFADNPMVNAMLRRATPALVELAA